MGRFKLLGYSTLLPYSRGEIERRAKDRELMYGYYDRYDARDSDYHDYADVIEVDPIMKTGEGSSPKSGAGLAMKAASVALQGIKAPMNALLSPAVVKHNGDYSAERLSNTAFMCRTVSKVDDFNHVAELYETNGYAVEYRTSDNLFQLHDRTLYDVVQCDDMVIAGLPTVELRELVKERFRNGLRLWHTKKYALNKVFITGRQYGVSLGSLCIKDNTEVSDG